jgi:hypothetical protein
MKKQPEPKPIPAGDRRVLLGMFAAVPSDDKSIKKIRTL